jgi:hypothetical protein
MKPAIKEYGGEYLAGGMKKTTAFVPKGCSAVSR